MTLWFTSDTHFGHANILTFTLDDGTPMRPFVSVEEMDEFMVERWNKVVKPSDHVYHLGDVAMRKEHLQTVKRLNGHKRLIFGNHDIFDYKHYVEVGFKKLMSYRVFDDIICSHIPLRESSIRKGCVNVHGHIHNNEQLPLPYVNVSVEVCGYRPVSLEEIRARKSGLDNRPWTVR